MSLDYPEILPAEKLAARLKRVRELREMLAICAALGVDVREVLTDRPLQIHRLVGLA